VGPAALVKTPPGIRAVFRLARAALHLLVGLAMVAAVFPWLPERGRVFLKARWSHQLLAVLGVRVRTSGIPPAGGMLVANHSSWLDIFAINALAPCTFVSKDDIREWPAIGWLSDRVGTIFIERGSRRAAHRTRECLVGEFRAGARICVFPEGTTGSGEHVLPFHGALFQSAIDTGVPVAPLLVRYTDGTGRPTSAAAYFGETSFWASGKSIVAASGLTADVTFLPQLDSAAMDRRHLAHHSHQMIAHALAAALTPSRPAPPDGHRATGIPADPPDEPPSDNHPTDSRNQAPADSSPA
jgi:1-acyl-sn-glycerol-3-phosphate acyltransferase